jgi:hypothetical protein
VGAYCWVVVYGILQCAGLMLELVCFVYGVMFLCNNEEFVLGHFNESSKQVSSRFYNMNLLCASLALNYSHLHQSEELSVITLWQLNVKYLKCYAYQIILNFFMMGWQFPSERKKPMPYGDVWKRKPITFKSKRWL